MIEDKLNLTYYSGQDLYSDGDVEEELLKAVQDKENLEKCLMEGNSWPHLYHLSNIRENILEWYDFNPKGSLLEIGSGCGALTGLFCSKVDHVVAIELSKRRSMINATRNEQYDNLTIMLGNFEDIQLTEKFDYVTLIGVFEYSICYLNSDNPFMDMLKRAKSFLKPGGKLIIAIENKYGVKYFAGATEDHSGRVFDGLENYTAVERVRTFSRKTLEKMLREAGFDKNDFYYPMPDYKLPNEIYSERHMPSFGSIRNACVSYDRDRYELIDERLLFDSLCEDGMFGDFANSFLVISEEEPEEGFERTEVEYAKYNRMRAPQFQISTRILLQSDNTRVVEKKALRSEAEKHIDTMVKNREKLLQGSTAYVPVEILSVTKDTIVFPYVEGTSLLRQMNASLGKKDKLLAALHGAMDAIYGKTEEHADFKMTETFQAVFGKQECEHWGKTFPVSNIDSTFGNFVQAEHLVCLDYEWVFDFPVPVDYLKYRTLYYYYGENAAYLRKYFSEQEFLGEFGLTEEQCVVFGKMEDAFQQFVHGENRKYIYTGNYEKKVINLGKNLQNNEAWFGAIMDDVNRLNHELGSHRRDLVVCRVDMHRKSELPEKVKRAIKDPKRILKKIGRKLTGK